MSIIDITLILSGYLFGSLSSAIIIAKMMSLPDPRSEGSNNPGATNMMRIGGKKAAIFTLLGDVLKGVIPVAITHFATLGADSLVLMCVAFAAFLGHLYPVFFEFKGGKGVATAIGVLFTAIWPIGLFICFTWASIYLLVRISSLSALTAFLLAPFFAFYMDYQDAVVYTTSLITIILFWRHKTNIQKLIAGTEGKPSK